EIGRDGAKEALRFKQFREFLRLPAECAVNKYGRIQIRFGNADQGALRCHLTFGTADVWAAAQQVCRNAGSNPGRNAGSSPGRNGLQWIGAELQTWPQLRCEVTGRDAEQGTERVIRLAKGDLKGRNRGASLFQNRLGLVHIKLGHFVDADPELLFDEGQGAFLNALVVLCDLDA